MKKQIEFTRGTYKFIFLTFVLLCEVLCVLSG